MGTITSCFKNKEEEHNQVTLHTKLARSFCIKARGPIFIEWGMERRTCQPCHIQHFTEDFELEPGYHSLVLPLIAEPLDQKISCWRCGNLLANIKPAFTCRDCTHAFFTQCNENLQDFNNEIKIENF